VGDIIIREGGNFFINQGAELYVKASSFFEIIGEDAIIWFMFGGMMLFYTNLYFHVKRKKDARRES
jgi:hypothetical protein